MSVHWLYLFLLLWNVSKASSDSNENVETQKKTEVVHSTMAPNSKFLNPHLDDATNLQFAIAAFGDEGKTPEDNKSKASEILQKLSESWGLNVPSREAKSLPDGGIVAFLHSLFSRNKNYKLKNA